MCNLGAAASLAALFQGCSQETPSQMELAGQEETGTQQGWDTQQVPDRLCGYHGTSGVFPGFDRVKSLAEKLSANACL